MEEELIKLSTGKLAESKDCDLNLYEENIWTFFIDEDSYAANYDCRDEHPDAQRIINCTQSLLHRWLRENHNLFVIIFPKASDIGGFGYYVAKPCDPNHIFDGSKKNRGFETYEEALEAGLVTALNLI
jgi:hypothetical protein